MNERPAPLPILGRGLSVDDQRAGLTFGDPSRITARVRLGRGEVVDIEREVELGGPLHSKGVLILGGFLGGRFGKTRPLSLNASLVFEQSYGGSTATAPRPPSFSRYCQRSPTRRSDSPLR
jgi:predicted ATP-dependent protease